VLGILLWWLGSLIAARPYRRYSDDDVAAIREKARRKL
jgi:hypothetical protein